MSVRVQIEDFNPGDEIAILRQDRNEIGAICSFIGTVRDVPLTLEHYPGMTERALQDIYDRACARFDVLGARIIHRYGPLKPGDNIVLVVALSRHRQSAFEAANFMMDCLKTEAPFWKLEDGHWVDQKQTDRDATLSWD